MKDGRMLLSNFNLLATAPGGVARLRELIMTLAVQGKLVSQDPLDEPADVLLQKIRAEKDRLIAEGKIRRDKLLAAIAKVEQPFRIPVGWEWQKLAEIGSWAIGSGFPHEAQGCDGLPILFAKVSDMNLLGNELEIVRTNHTIDAKTVERLRINVHHAGTVVFPKIGGAIATNKRRILIRPTAIDNNCLGIAPSAAMSTSYLFLLLSSIDFTVYQAGTSVPALSQGILGQIPVGVPPLTEQSRIVTRVEELMRVCDALEAKGKLEAAQHAQLLSTLLGTLADSDTPEALADNWQRIATHFDLLLDRPQAIDAFEQTILQLAVRGLLVPQDLSDEPASVLLQKIRVEKDRLIAGGKIKRDKPLAPVVDGEKPFRSPFGWEWVRWADIAMKIGDIDHKMPSETKVGIPYVSPRDFYGANEIDFDGAKKITRNDYLELASKIRPEKGDLIYPRYGTIGVVRMVDEDREFLASYSCAVIKVLRGCIDPKYQYLFSISECVRLQASSATNTTTQPNVGLKSIQEYLFPLPPLPEQSRIVTRVEELRRLCAELRQRLSASQTSQAHLAEALVVSVVE